MPQRMTHDFDFDLCVIGAGPGGYVAAIRAAQLGLNVVCIDKRETLGGTCLNVGCIPSKALLHSSHYYDEINSGSLDRFGLEVPKINLNLTQMQKDKDGVVQELTSGIAYLFKKNKVEFVQGNASFVKPHVVQIGKENISAKDIVIATGSKPASLPGIQLDGERVVDSTGALSFDNVPSHLVVVGGGVIGLELGSVWRRLGSRVTVIEFQDHILGGMDADLCKEALKIYKNQGLKFELGNHVTSVKSDKNGVTISCQPLNTEKNASLEASHILVATGRLPNTEKLGLGKVNVVSNDRGLIETDDKFRTASNHIWAIGDVIPGPMLAHRAEDEGIAVAENIAGLTGVVNHKIVPSVVYTHPEIASVGLTESEAKSQTKIKVGAFSFQANSRAKANRDTEGFVKVIADAESDEVLGVHIIGSQAGNMIAQAAQAMEFGATSEDIAYTCHAHPTHAEALKEAAMSVLGSPIHQ